MKRTAYPTCKICHARVYDDVEKLFEHLEKYDKVDLNKGKNKELDSDAICEKYFEYYPSK